MIKECKYCGKEFDGSSAAKFCCASHRLAYHNAECSLHKREIGDIVKCDLCENYFKITDFRQKKRLHCPNCSKKLKHERVYAKDDSSDAKGKQVYRAFKRKLKHPKLSIGEISVLARQAGMSYGQYVAKVGI